MLYRTPRMLRRSFLSLAILGILSLAAGCSGEGEGSVAPPKSQGNKARLEKLQSKLESFKSKGSSK